MLSSIKEYITSPSKDDNRATSNGNSSENDPEANSKANGNGGGSSSAEGRALPTETTSLLGHPNDDPSKQLFPSTDESPPPPPPGSGFLCFPAASEMEHDVVHPLPPKPPSAHDLYFNKARNPTVQRYYRFHATPITPIVALHKRPGVAGNTSSNTAAAGGGVTGLLRRSAVVPSHGIDSTDNWILVSVGGRSGWARKKSPGQHFSGFTLAEQFAATEGWMGNHAFLCKGKCMLGSDAPSLVFTNVLMAVGFVWHFVIVLPKLQQMEARGDLSVLWPFSNNGDRSDVVSSDGATPITTTLFWWSAALGTLSVITLWISALMDPGIIPPVSSPVKAPVPENVPLGGPLGYRYCSTCNIFRPPRSKHCNSCNVCVSKFDQYVTRRAFELLR